MSYEITPRVAEVIIYQGEDLSRMRELFEAMQIEELAGPRRIGDVTPSPSKAKAQKYDDAVTAAAGRAVTAQVKQVGNRRWRSVRDENPPREGNETDKMFGFNRDKVGEILLPESLIAPVFGSTDERDGWLDALSEGDWDRLVSAAIGVNTSVVDPKALAAVSLVDQMSDESSKPPERLA